jgi:hypothetical protein
MDPPWSCTGERRFCDEDRLELEDDFLQHLPGKNPLGSLNARDQSIGSLKS